MIAVNDNYIKKYIIVYFSKASEYFQRFEKNQYFLFFLFTVSLFWPILLNGGVYIFGDSPGYLNGGRLALDFAFDHVGRIFSPQGGDAATGTSGGGSAGVSGVRSIVFSVYAGITRHPGHSMFVMCLLQAGLTLYVLWLLLRLTEISRVPSATVLILLTTALLSPVAWFVVLVMPDIYAGLALASIMLLTYFNDRLVVTEKVVLAGVIGFSVANHLSHPPIFGLLTALSGLLFLRRCTKVDWKRHMVAFSWVALPALLGLCAMIGANAVGFKQTSVSGKRYPIVLASSIQAGPARWYLKKACAETPEVYAVCEVYKAVPMPDTSGEFLFGVNGVRQRATPEQMERIRNEEGTILKNATLAYPWVTISAAVGRSAFQFVRIGLDDHRFDNRLLVQPDGSVRASETYDPKPLFKRFFRILFGLELLAGVIFFVWVFKKRPFAPISPIYGLLWFSGMGVLINAFVCGAMSAVTDRYQGRIIWVFLTVCLIAGAELWRLRARTPKLAEPAKVIEEPRSIEVVSRRSKRRQMAKRSRAGKNTSASK